MPPSLADASAAPYRPPTPNQARRKHLWLLFYGQEHEGRIPQSIHGADLPSNMDPRCHSGQGSGDDLGGEPPRRYNIARSGR